MKIGTVCNHEQKFKERIRDIFRRAEHFCFSSKELNEVYSKEILQSAVYARLPRYSKTFLQGYNEALRDMFWMKVKWVFPYKGILYDGFADLPKAGKALYRSKDMTGFHVHILNEKKHFTGQIEQYNTGLERSEWVVEVDNA